MNIIVNPFVVSGHIPDEYFCDRQQESAKLEQFLCNQQNVVLTAARRMGKTTLIDHVVGRPKIADNFITISIDILDTGNLNEFVFVLGNAVFEKIAKKSDKLLRPFAMAMKSLQASFGYDPVMCTPTFDIKLGDLVAPDYTLKEIFDYLEQVEHRCIVVIDEFQQITYYPEKNIEATLRKYIQKLKNVNFVFAGSHRRIMSEMFGSEKRPFYNSARNIELEPIASDVYAEFVDKHFKVAGKFIEQEAVQLVYETFQGVTLYNQQIMNDAFNATPNGKTCDVETIRLLIDNYVIECETKLRELMQYVTEQQKAVLYAILEDEPVKAVTSGDFTKRHRLKSPSATQSAIKTLLKSDMITKRDGLYSLSDPLLDLWLKKKVLYK